MVKKTPVSVYRLLFSPSNKRIVLLSFQKTPCSMYAGNMQYLEPIQYWNKILKNKISSENAINNNHLFSGKYPRGGRCRFQETKSHSTKNQGLERLEIKQDIRYKKVKIYSRKNRR